MNGIPKPSEYASNKLNDIDGVVTASVSIVPSMGPTHGVHPIANAKPKINDIGQLALKSLMTIFLSMFKELIFVENNRNNPNEIMIVPATKFRLSENPTILSDNALLINTPRIEKTIENPNTKNTVFNSMFILFT